MKTKTTWENADAGDTIGKPKAEAAPAGGQHMITLTKGGSAEKTLPLSQVEIPDLWHIAQAELDLDCRRAILTCWHNAHDLKRIVEEQMDLNAQLLEALRETVARLEHHLCNIESCDMEDADDTTLAKARAALAAAEGRVAE